MNKIIIVFVLFIFVSCRSDQPVQPEVNQNTESIIPTQPKEIPLGKINGEAWSYDLANGIYITEKNTGKEKLKITFKNTKKQETMQLTYDMSNGAIQEVVYNKKAIQGTMQLHLVYLHNLSSAKRLPPSNAKGIVKLDPSQPLATGFLFEATLQLKEKKEALKNFDQPVEIKDFKFEDVKYLKL